MPRLQPNIELVLRSTPSFCFSHFPQLFAMSVFHFQGRSSFEDNWRELEIMAAAGVELVELQFPFSEPSADGPLFVRANQHAIEKGVHVQDCFIFMRRVTDHFDFKVLMMGYFNTVFKTGLEPFMQRLKKAGAVGFILPDLPLEEAAHLHEIAADLQLDPILLMTPTNSEARLRQLAASARGFVYCVARKGVTGSKTSMNKEVGAFIDRCRRVTKLPLAIGFGVSQRADINFIAEHGEIAVIGTAALKIWESGGAPALADFFAGLR